MSYATPPGYPFYAAVPPLYTEFGDAASSMPQPQEFSRTPCSAPDASAGGSTAPPTDNAGGNTDSDDEHSDASVDRRVLARLRVRRKNKSNNVEASAAAGPGKGNRNNAGGKKKPDGTAKKAKAIWIDAEDAIMTEVLKEKVETMVAGDNGFTPTIYLEIANRCNEEVEDQKGPSKTADIVSTHYHYDVALPGQRAPAKRKARSVDGSDEEENEEEDGREQDDGADRGQASTRMSVSNTDRSSRRSRASTRSGRAGASAKGSREEVGERLIERMSADLELKTRAEDRAFDQSLEGQASRMFEKLERLRETMQDEDGVEVLTEHDQELLEGYLPTNPSMMAFFLACPDSRAPSLVKRLLRNARGQGGEGESIT
ncbi:hypothetical protein QFC21_007323 [Naganishia friedmannii]|uniref:Uncharacterized protein n=1 Tax=Naganishia friedmannii TaxID=89922 RepID=A0ACC2UVL5_9TREE|nr:hypothetical protein QFC21_007323 [Naganishia friedmannii]